MTDLGRQSWESFWRDLAADGDTALWDSSAALAAAEHLRRARPHLDEGLPLIDVGCGSGRQTRELAGSFARVVGVDLAEEALEIARREHPAPNLDYRRLDLLDPAAVGELAAELGDANVYLRGVLHQLPPADQDRAVRAIAVLLGARGRLVAQELTDVTTWAVRDLLADGGPMDRFDRLRRHFGFGAAATPVRGRQLDRLISRGGLHVLASGDDQLQTTQIGGDGEPVTLPTAWVIAQAARP
jgi:SAM-dependent methyltransferase